MYIGQRFCLFLFLLEDPTDLQNNAQIITFTWAVRLKVFIELIILLLKTNHVRLSRDRNPGK